jgi:pyruvate,water dikinase
LIVKEKELVLWFEDVRNTDIPVVGGKNASLGEMINAGLACSTRFCGNCLFL